MQHALREKARPLLSPLTRDFGYLQHGAGTAGPFRTERVTVRHTHPFDWHAHFEGVWRKVHVQVKRTFITYQGEKITIQIEGV